MKPKTIIVGEKEELCAHCGLRLEQGRPMFCCSGCETAFHIITGGGWQQYYKVRERETAQPVTTPNALSFAYLDTEEYRARHAQESEGFLEADWYLDGLRCGACSWLVEQVAGKQEGIIQADLNFGEARLTLHFSPSARLSELATLLADLGYVAGLAPQVGDGRTRSTLKLGLVGALAGNLMLMSVPFYVGLNDVQSGWIFGLISFLLAIPVLFYGGREYFVRAYLALRHRLPSLDLPIAIGLGGAFVLSTYHLLQGAFDGLFYDSMGMLVFFLLLGRTARESAIGRAMAESRRLLARMPQLVQVVRGGETLHLAATQVVVGDLIRLRGGDVLPLDATLISEQATLNLHVVSGEARPVNRYQGAALSAGSINMGGLVDVRATSVFNDSRFARLETLAHGLSAAKTGVLGNRKAYLFLIFALSSALLGAWLWWPVSPGRAFTVMLTVLIVVCPCALALARPVAEAFAMRRAAAMGAWIKQSDLFDRLVAVERVCFDKTGILTEGKPTICATLHLTDRPHWLEAAVAALEAQVNHPLAEAFLQKEGPRVAVGEPCGVQVVPGAGIRGLVDGHELVVGSPSGLPALGAGEAAVEDILSHAAQLDNDLTLVAVLVDDHPAALFALDDTVRPEAASLTAHLKKRGLKLVMLSGDRPGTVARVAEMLGFHSRLGRLLPEHKLAYIQEQGAETTLMVGDGFNDMGALARASVGVTHAFGSESALRFAGVIFADRHLGRLGGLFDLAETVVLAERRGVMLSLGYNFLAVVLALQGAIGPLGAALLMPASSLTLVAVIATTFHFRRKRWAS